jgi:tryptophanyl-tRNA synthetase
MKARVFSGIQPTGSPHIGNYLGALKNWAKIQYDYDSIYCIVDLHAVTVYQDPAELRAKIEELAGMLLAIGIDPTHSSLVVQSAIPAHAELAWMLTCVTPVGWLERMTQYKMKTAAPLNETSLPEKAEVLKRPRHLPENPDLSAEDKKSLAADISAAGPPRDAVEEKESVGDGLLQYPVLMAADILLYNAAIVPVGDDQKQHVELTRDIAQRFNSLYGARASEKDFFVVPATHLPTVGARVMGLDNPNKKMSKSATGSGHAVSLLDPPETIRKKFMRATTDSNPAVDFENLGAGVQNLLTIFQAFTECTNDELHAKFNGMRYGDLKKTVAEAVIAALDPIQKRYRDIMDETGYVARVLDEGAQRIIPIANATIERVKRAMGLYTPR